MTRRPALTQRQENLSPSVLVSKITFSDGTSISPSDNDVIIFVGPNNSGKSAALREIQNGFGDSVSGIVVKDCKLEFRGSPDAIGDYIKSNSQLVYMHNRHYYVGYNFEIPEYELISIKEEPNRLFKSFFTLIVSTDQRLSGSDRVKSVAYRREQPKHPIHLLVMDKTLESRVSHAFSSAFGRYLYVNRAGGSEIELFISTKSEQERPLDDFSDDAHTFFDHDASPLSAQGDGMRAFTTLALNSLAISQQSILLIDEPEAFLHPPQARQIGALISHQQTVNRQVFIATHSSDVLKGVLENTGRKIKILRISRSREINIVNVLDPGSIDDLSKDPLIRYSGILDGIFHEHVIVCEADTDCQFYSAILETCDTSRKVRPDALFVQSAGKHRMAKLGNVARKLGVPFSVIVDIDVLNERSLFKQLCEVCDVEWSMVETHWKRVYEGIESKKATLTAAQLIAELETAVNSLRNKEISVAEFLKQIRDKIKANSPWESVKIGGRSALPLGDVVEHFDVLTEICGRSGLWIVPVGELEGFCRTLSSRKGSSWIIELAEKFDLNSSPELSEAREFLQKVWGNAMARSPSVQ